MNAGGSPRGGRSDRDEGRHHRARRDPSLPHHHSPVGAVVLPPLRPGDARTPFLHLPRGAVRGRPVPSLTVGRRGPFRAVVWSSEGRRCWRAGGRVWPVQGRAARRDARKTILRPRARGGAHRGDLGHRGAPLHRRGRIGDPPGRPGSRRARGEERARVPTSRSRRPSTRAPVAGSSSATTCAAGEPVRRTTSAGVVQDASPCRTVSGRSDSTVRVALAAFVGKSRILAAIGCGPLPSPTASHAHGRTTNGCATWCPPRESGTGGMVSTVSGLVTGARRNRSSGGGAASATPWSWRNGGGSSATPASGGRGGGGGSFGSTGGGAASATP